MIDARQTFYIIQVKQVGPRHPWSDTDCQFEVGEEEEAWERLVELRAQEGYSYQLVQRTITESSKIMKQTRKRKT